MGIGGGQPPGSMGSHPQGVQGGIPWQGSGGGMPSGGPGSQIPIALQAKTTGGPIITGGWQGAPHGLASQGGFIRHGGIAGAQTSLSLQRPATRGAPQPGMGQGSNEQSAP